MQCPQIGFLQILHSVVPLIALQVLEYVEILRHLQTILHLLENWKLPNIVLNVTVDSSGIVPSAAGSIAECGQYGVADDTTTQYTTAQRIYDCSKRVTEYAGIGTHGGASVPFNRNGTNNNPNANWFLVGCPESTNQKLCAWLAPQVESGNHTIGINCNGSNCDPTAPNIEVGTRMVWSGVLNNGTIYTFGEVNGTNNASPPSANCNGNGECAVYQGSTPTSHISKHVCGPAGLQCLLILDQI